MAFSYNKKNLANTTITGAITSSDTSITVDDATVFPSGYFYATLMPSSEMSTFSNSEIVLVTNISSNTLTIARGQKSTTARAFSAGAIITNGVYTEDLDFAQSVGKKIFNAAWGGQESPYYKITDDMLKVVPDEGTSIRAIFDTDYASGTARLSINESTSGVATVSGSSISITDAENLAPVDVKLKGDTEQLTTTGKNKFNLRKWHNNARRNNVSNTNIDDSGNGFWITYTAGADAFIGWAYRSGTITNSADIASLIPAKPNMNYTISVSGTGSGSGTNTLGNSSYVTYVDSSYNVLNTSYIGLSHANSAVFETPANTAYILFRLGVNGRPDTRFNFENIQLEEGRAKTSFEPYTGGEASPSPDCPQNVQTVTGEQTITISDGGSGSEEFKINLGKNLWPSTTATASGGIAFADGQSVFYSTEYVHSALVDVRPNTTYTLSASKGVIGEGTGGGGVLYYNGSTYLGYTIRPTGGSFTTPANCTKIRFNFYVADSYGGLTPSQITNIQLEEGSTATTYAPYFTPIELCKIGTYQDYIYKDNGDWYIHKETATYTFTGSENCNIYNNGVNVRFGDNGSPSAGDMANDGIEPIMIFSDETIVYPIYSSVASADAIQHVWFGHKNKISYGSASYGAISISFGGTALTKEQYLEKLAGTKIAYIRRTPTETQITDSTLISQLNALSEVTLDAGTNSIVVTGGLDGILEVQYYVSGSGVNLVPIVNGAYVADDNTRNVAPVKAGIPYDLTYHSGNWYVMNMVKKITSDDIDTATYNVNDLYTFASGYVVTGSLVSRAGLLVGNIEARKSDYSDFAANTNVVLATAGPRLGRYQLPATAFFTSNSSVQEWGTDDVIGYGYFGANGSIEFRAPASSKGTFNYIRFHLVLPLKSGQQYTRTTDTAQQTRSVPDDETDDKKSGEIEPEEPIEEQQNR